MKNQHLSEYISIEKTKKIVSNALETSVKSICIIDQFGYILFSEGDLCSSMIGGSNKQEQLTVSLMERFVTGKLNNKCANKCCYINAMPLNVGDSISGYIVFVSNDDSYNENLLSSIHIHIQDGVDSSYELKSLSKEIVRNYEELALLYDLSTKLSEKPEMEVTCATIAHQVLMVLQVESIAIMLIDEERKMVASEIILGMNDKAYPAYELKIEEGITGQVISSRTSKIVGNVKNHKGFVDPGYPIKSMLSVPISVRDKVIGTINVGDKINKQVFSTNDEKLMMSITLVAGMAIHNSILFQEVTGLFWNTVKSLTSAIDAKDKYTMGHSKRVAELTVEIAHEMNVEDELLNDIQLAALLHDIGKIGTPEKILFKEGTLTSEEWEEVKKHPYHSSKILKEIKQFSRVAEWVMYEHERYDGLGYPKNLVGEEIPLPSRIIAAADAFDAMTSNRSYRPGMSDKDALRLIQNGSGTQFDPQVIAAFMSAYGKGLIKSVSSN